MKLIIVAILITVSACTLDANVKEEKQLTPREVGAIVLDNCGQFSGLSGYAVAFEQLNGVDVAIMSRADFEGIIRASHALKEWAYCASGQ